MADRVWGILWMRREECFDILSVNTIILHIVGLQNSYLVVLKEARDQAIGTGYQQGVRHMRVIELYLCH